MKKIGFVVIVLMMIVPVSAQKIGFNGIGVKAGIIIPESPFDALGFQGGVNANLGEISDGLFWVMGLGYWSNTTDVGGLDFKLSNFQIVEDVHYFLSGKQEGAYVGGGISYNILSFETSFTLFGQTTTATTDDSKIGFHPLVGYVFELGNMNAFVEAKYALISDFNTIDVAFGVNFPM